MSLQIAKKSLQIVLSSQGSRRVDANLGDATGLLRICRSEEQSSLRDLDSASYDAKNLIVRCVAGIATGKVMRNYAPRLPMWEGEAFFFGPLTKRPDTTKRIRSDFAMDRLRNKQMF